jgi:hypothetical protein
MINSWNFHSGAIFENRLKNIQIKFDITFLILRFYPSHI